ncbi:internal scaffolding protein [Microviridae sp.]|nr:internal scaffolding protein [Microviridae sp.]
MQTVLSVRRRPATSTFQKSTPAIRTRINHNHVINLGETKMRRHPRVKSPVGEVSMTKQSFKDECNINKIMDKFQKTGAINHYASHEPTYGDATPGDLLNAQLIISNANSMFEELPSSIRKKFDNDPAKFLEFVQDERNQEEMIELGLKKDSRAEPPRNRRERAADTPETPSEAPEDTISTPEA